MHRQFGSVLLVLALAALSAPGQVCINPADVLLSNDSLPPVPSGATPVSVIQGLGNGEAAAAVFDTTPLSPQGVKVNLAAVGYMNVVGTNGIQAAVNLQIYDGVTFDAAGVPTLGPLAFDYASATGSNLQLTSHAINTTDLSAFNVTVTSGKLVVAWSMVFNAGAPQTNFATDNGSIQFTCNPSVTPLQKNLIFIQGQGWRDAALATVQGIPLCPVFYSGNWIIRACVEPMVNPTNLLVSGSPTTAGGFVNVTFDSPNHPGQFYFGAPAFTANAGSPTVYGTFPLDFDPLLQAYLQFPVEASQVFFNFNGNLGPTGTAPGIIFIPPTTPPLSFLVAFIVMDPTLSFFEGISSPVTIQVL